VVPRKECPSGKGRNPWPSGLRNGNDMHSRLRKKIDTIVAVGAGCSIRRRRARMRRGDGGDMLTWQGQRKGVAYDAGKPAPRKRGALRKGRHQRGRNGRGAKGIKMPGGPAREYGKYRAKKKKERKRRCSAGVIHTQTGPAIEEVEALDPPLQGSRQGSSRATEEKKSKRRKEKERPTITSLHAPGVQDHKATRIKAKGAEEGEETNPRRHIYSRAQAPSA